MSPFASTRAPTASWSGAASRATRCAAVRAGAGAALLPHSLIRADVANGSVVNWGGCRGREQPVELWVLHSSRRLVSPKVSAFVEFLAESFPTRQI